MTSPSRLRPSLSITLSLASSLACSDPPQSADGLPYFGAAGSDGGNPAAVDPGTGDPGTGDPGSGDDGAVGGGTDATGNGADANAGPPDGASAGSGSGAEQGNAGADVALDPGAADDSSGAGGGAGGASNDDGSGAGGSAMGAAGAASMEGGAAGQGGAPMPSGDPPDDSPSDPPNDPTTDPAPNLGCSGSAFFCEDFESYPVGAAAAANGWAPAQSNGSVSIDDAMAFGGSRSLHVQTQGNGFAHVRLGGFSPPDNSFFARMYVYVTEFPSAPDYAHFTLVELAGNGAGLIRPIGGQYIPGQGILWGVGSDAGPTGDWTNWRPSAPTEPGRWVCMEWEMTSADSSINVWIDERFMADLSVSTNDHGGNQVPFVFPQFNTITFGWQLYQGGSTPNQFDLWYDDIVVASQRVGCGG